MELGLDATRRSAPTPTRLSLSGDTNGPAALEAPPMTTLPALNRAAHLADVRYAIRGPLARRALELEQQGHKVLKLNIGNPAQFGFRTPENIRQAIVEHLGEAEGYSHQKGIVVAREAVAAEAARIGVKGVGPDDVFMGNGCSELILMALEAMLEPGDEVLLPAPDYPLWTAAVTLAGGRPVHYLCRPERDFQPDPDEIAGMVTKRTRAIVVINPNNPTGAVYPKEVLQKLAKLAEERQLVLLADEIYDRVLYDGAVHVPLATLCTETLVGTFGGLSKVHRACGQRVGWLTFSGQRAHAKDYLEGLETLASLRLCSNVPGQYAVHAALTGPASIYELTSDAGRLGRQRRALLQGVEKSEFLSCVAPRGALYAFPSIDKADLPHFSDARFAMELLEQEHALVIPGSSFNVPWTNHMRLTFLPDETIMSEVFVRLERQLQREAARRG